MSEEQVQKEDQEPSMEDILASIRNILAEDEKADEGKNGSPNEAERKETDTTEMADGISDDSSISSVESEEETGKKSLSSVSEGKESNSNMDRLTSGERGDQSNIGATDIFELTQDMVSDPDMMSNITMEQSADLLGDLARAIIDRRDMKVADEGSNANITLEMLVREMLKPLLREWLDRNLPYLIERMVKKEIDQMVNRAQRLDDSL